MQFEDKNEKYVGIIHIELFFLQFIGFRTVIF